MEQLFTSIVEMIDWFYSGVLLDYLVSFFKFITGWVVHIFWHTVIFLGMISYIIGFAKIVGK